MKTFNYVGQALIAGLKSKDVVLRKDKEDYLVLSAIPIDGFPIYKAKSNALYLVSVALYLSSLILVVFFNASYSVFLSLLFMALVCFCFATLKRMPHYRLMRIFWKTNHKHKYSSR